MFDFFGPPRRANLREVVARVLNHQMPDPTRSTAGLPSPAPATPGRMSATQFANARVLAGPYYFHHIEAEHGEEVASD
jgi:hypothetical protein